MPSKAKFTNKTKEAIYERENYSCIFCGAVNSLHFHHIWYGTESNYGKNRNDVNEGITVCSDHHLEIHSCSKGEGKRQEAIDYLQNKE